MTTGFLWCLFSVWGCFIEVSVFLGCPSPGLLAERSGFCQVFLSLCLLLFQDCCFLGHSVWNVWGRCPENSLCVLPCVPRSLIGLPSLYLLELTYLFHIQSQVILAVLNGKNRGKSVYSIFTKLKAPGGDSSLLSLIFVFCWIVRLQWACTALIIKQNTCLQLSSPSSPKHLLFIKIFVIFPLGITLWMVSFWEMKAKLSSLWLLLFKTEDIPRYYFPSSITEL